MSRGTPAAVFRGISFSSAIRLIGAPDFVRACLTGLTGAGITLVAFLPSTCRATFAIKRFSLANGPAKSASD